MLLPYRTFFKYSVGDYNEETHSYQREEYYGYIHTPYKITDKVIDEYRRFFKRNVPKYIRKAPNVEYAEEINRQISPTERKIPYWYFRIRYNVISCKGRNCRTVIDRDIISEDFRPRQQDKINPVPIELRLLQRVLGIVN